MAMWSSLMHAHTHTCIHAYTHAHMHTHTHTHAQHTQVLIQPSMQRAYFGHEYEAAGALITNDLSEADTIVGKQLFIVYK